MINLKKCIYCKQINVPDNNVVDFCKRCGEAVWGPKMYNAIVSGMEDGKGNGLFDQGNPDF